MKHYLHGFFMHLIVLFLWSLGQWTPSTSAQNPDSQTVITGELSLEDTVKLTLNYNRALQTVMQEKEVAKGQIWEAYGYAFPHISVDGSYTRLDDVSSFQIDDQVISMGSLDNYSSNLKIVQPVYHGGAIKAGVSAAKIYRELADENIRNAVQNVVYQATRAYYQVVLAEKQHEVQKEFQSLAEQHLKDVEARRKYGVASEFNVLRAEVERSNANAQSIAYMNQMHQARHQLLKTMGVSQDSTIQLMDVLEYTSSEITENEALERAMAHRADISGSDLKVRLQRESLANARSAYWPSVDAYYNFNVSKPESQSASINEWGTAWQAGLTVRFDIFTMNRTGRIVQEKARLNQQSISRMDVREQVVFEVRSALSALQDADQFVKAQELTVDQANEGLRLAEVGYREGTLDQVSVMEARAALHQARLLYWNSLFNHQMARLELQRAIGLLPALPVDQTNGAAPIPDPKTGEQ